MSFHRTSWVQRIRHTSKEGVCCADPQRRHQKRNGRLKSVGIGEDVIVGIAESLNFADVYGPACVALAYHRFWVAKRYAGFRIALLVH